MRPNAPKCAGSHALDPQFQTENIWSDKELLDGIKDCLRFFAGSTECYRKAYADLEAFRSAKLLQEQLDDAKDSSISPLKWWIMHGVEWPDLQDVAVKIESVMCANGPVERNGSTWKHTIKNRPDIGVEKAGKLVYLQHNLREIRVQKLGLKKRAVEWGFMAKEEGV